MADGTYTSCIRRCYCWRCAGCGPSAKPGRGATTRAGRGLVAAARLLLALEVGRTGWFIVQAAPNQQVYFGFLPPATAERLFERDYWAASYRYGLEWLLRHDPSPRITVTGPQLEVVYENWLLLTPAQQRRIVLAPAPQPARYYITAYRWHPQPYADSLGGPEVLAYRPGGGIKALSIFRRDAPARCRPCPLGPIGASGIRCAKCRATSCRRLVAL